MCGGCLAELKELSGMHRAGLLGCPGGQDQTWTLMILVGPFHLGIFPSSVVPYLCVCVQGQVNSPVELRNENSEHWKSKAFAPSRSEEIVILKNTHCKEKPDVS